MASTAPCPRCNRPNASFRATCLYCGAEMPNPTARPVETRKAPDNLDELVREAMRGGGTQKLRAALHGAAGGAAPSAGASELRQGGAPPRPGDPGGPAQAGAPARPADPAQAGAPSRRAADVPQAGADARPAGTSVGRTAPPGAEDRPTQSGPAQSVRWTDALQRAAQRVALVAADPEALREALLDVEESLAVGFSTLSSAPTLPPIRQPWVLVLPPLGDPEAIAAALGVDHATARLLAQGRWPRIGLRGDSPNLGRAPSSEHLPIAREALLAIGPAFGVLGLDPGDLRWRVTEEAIWLADPQGGGIPARIDDVSLIVPGEVEMRTTRAAPAENRWLRKRLSVAGAGSERRVRVADLHTPGGIFRLVEGVTRTEGLPGHDPGSARHAFTAVINHLAERYPDAEVLDERICAVGGDGRSAWPLWEEHTRVTRVYTELRGRTSAR